MKATLLSTSAANKHVPAKSTGATLRAKRLIRYTALCALQGVFGSQLVWRKPMSALRQNLSSPTGLFLHLHSYHRASVSLPAISLVLILPQGCMGGTSKRRVPFWDAEKNERLSLLTVSDEQCPGVAGNGYVSPFFLYVTHWNDRRYDRGVMDSAVQQELTCKGWIVE